MAQGTNDTEPVDPFTLRYKVLGEIGEGSYSKVLKCRRRDSSEVFACKRLKHGYRTWAQVAEIPEIVTLRKLVKHPNILHMTEIHFDPGRGRVSLVFELMDMNLYELIKDRKRLLQEHRVRSMLFQLIRGLRHLHKHGIFHRDVKPENILLKRTNNEEEEILKLGDLGSVRGLYSRPPYTEYISTRWYRSPECLLTTGFYSIKMDMWATGCVFYEVLTLRPLFPGGSEVDQINRIHNIVGPPPAKVLHKFIQHMEESRHYPNKDSKQGRSDNIKKTLVDLKNGNGKNNFEWYFSGNGGEGVERLLPKHISPDAKDLLSILLQYDPDSRPTAHRAMGHPFFQGLREATRKSLDDLGMPGDVTVTIGTTVKTLAEADGMMIPELRTLGDTKPKRLPREIPSKIPVLHKPSADVAKLKPSPRLNNNNNNNGPSSVLNNYNLNNIVPPHVLPPKEEPKGKKLKSYDEFSQKSKDSLPYEIVHIDKSRLAYKSEFHQSDSTLATSSSLPPRQSGPLGQTHSTIMSGDKSRRVVKETKKDYNETSLISPAEVRRINENHRLAQLGPVGNTENDKGKDLSSIFKKKPTTKTTSGGQVDKTPGKVQETTRKALRVVNGYEMQHQQQRLNQKREDGNPYHPEKSGPLMLKQYKSLHQAQQRNDLIQTYGRQENMSPPALSHRLSQGSGQGYQPLMAKRRPVMAKEKSSLLDYQEFSARYKQNPNPRRRREESLPSASSSSGGGSPQVETRKESPRRRRWEDRRKEEQRRPIEPPDSYAAAAKSIREREKYKFIQGTTEVAENEGGGFGGDRKLSRAKLNEFLKNNVINPPVVKKGPSRPELMVAKDRGSEDEEDEFFPPTHQVAKQQHKGHALGFTPLLLQQQGTVKGIRGHGSESVLPRLRKPPSDDRGLFASNSFYPSSHGRIRVSKPSLSLRSPPSHAPLPPPPFLRQSEQGPFALNPRDSTKFQRESVTKKKYTFLHEKQDFLFSKKSKLG